MSDQTFGQVAEPLRVASRPDGWWVEETDGAETFGPFPSLRDVEEFLDWVES